MNKGLLVGLAFVLAAGFAPSAFAWSISADTPVQFTFDKKSADTGGKGLWQHSTVENVSGYKVALKTPFFLGIGYEDYSVNARFGQPGQTVPAKVDFTFTDVFVELPVQVVHISLGYGMGTALLSSPTPGVPKAKSADATQAFLVLGLPLGPMLDVHVGYHWISADRSDFINANPPGDKTQLSGQMLSAGLRLGM